GLYLTKQGYEYSRYAILATYTLFLVSGILGRLFAVFSVNYFRAAGLNICRYGIVGTGIEGNLIRNYFRERKELGYLFCGDLSKEPVTPGKIEEFIIQNRLDFLYCCLSNLNLAEVQTILHTAEKHRTQVRLIPDLKGFVSPHV